MSVGAVLTAAGSGTRLGLDLPKALVDVGGAPLVVHAARALVAARSASGEPVAVLVVTAPPARARQVEAVLAADEVVAACPATVRVVPGGPTRQLSVAAGLAALPDEVDVVLVHDAARAFAPPALAGRVVDAVRAGHAAVVPGLAVTDTVKRVRLGAGDGHARDGHPVRETVPRADLRAVQTPQGFTRELLARAHAAGGAAAHDEATAASDDGGLVELLGEDVWVVPGDEAAAKITTARDLAVARALHAGGDR